MPRRDIPGYYYDQERGRYFRIVYTGEASGSGMSGYSLSAVAEARRQEATAKRQKTDKSQRNVERLEHSYERKRRQQSESSRCLSGYRIKRQLGMAIDQDLACVYARDLKTTGKWRVPDIGCLYCMTWDSVNRQIILGPKHHGMAISIPERTLKRSTETYDMMRDGDAANIGPANGGHTPVRVGNYYLKTMDPFPSTVTSISMSGRWLVSTGFVMTGIGGSIRISRLDSSLDDGEFYGQTRNLQYTPSQKQSILCSSIVSTSDTDVKVAVGGTHGAILIEPLKTGYFQNRYHTSSDVQSVALLPQRSEFVCGCRNGSIFVYDARMSTRSSQMLARPVSHGNVASTVTHVKPIENSNYLLISGLGTSLGLYDMRYLKSWNDETTLPSSKEAGALPALEFEEFDNLYNIHHGCDVWNGPWGSMISVSGDNMLNIYDTRHAEPIYTKSLSQSWNRLAGAAITKNIDALKWTPEGALLMVSNGSLIERLGVGDWR